MISAANIKNIGSIRSGPGDLVTSRFFNAEQTSEELIWLKTNSIVHKERSAVRNSEFTVT